MTLILAAIDELRSYREELIELMEYSQQINYRSPNGRKEAMAAYEKLISYYEQGKTNVWLAIEDSNLAGYAQFFQKENGRVHLNEIAVGEKYQDNGIGTRLIMAVENSAKELNAEFVELFCNEGNLKAKALYDKNHYVIERCQMFKKI